MKLMLIMALILNLVILGCELYALGHIKGKLNILKYYTYLQNFLSLIISFVCSVYLTISIISGETMPEFVIGLRYVLNRTLYQRKIKKNCKIKKPMDGALCRIQLHNVPSFIWLYRSYGL